MMNNIIFRQMSPAEFKSTYCERVYLNKGEYGSVSRYKDSRTNKDVAIKELMKDHNLSTFRREVDTMMAVNHPNILTCSDYFYRNSDKTHCLVLEYCSKGSLKDNQIQVFQWPDIRKVQVCLQIAMGVNALHEKDIMHRDIKPGNILFDENFQIKVCDFGFCRDDPENFELEKSDHVGSPLYRDPNVKSKIYTKKCDIYSLGITFDTIFRKGSIFKSRDIFSFKVELETFHQKDKLPKISQLKCDPQMKQIILCCLQKQEVNRISSGDLVQKLAKLFARLSKGNQQGQSGAQLHSFQTPAHDAKSSFKKKEKMNDSVEKISTQDSQNSKAQKQKQLIEQFREFESENKGESPHETLAKKLRKSQESVDQSILAYHNNKPETEKQAQNAERKKDPIYSSEGSSVRKGTKYEKPVSCNFRNLSLRACYLVGEKKQKAENFIKVYAFFELRRSKIRQIKNLSLITSIPPIYLKVAVFVALYAYLRFLDVHRDFMSGKSSPNAIKTVEDVCSEDLNVETKQKFLQMINSQKKIMCEQIQSCMNEVHKRKKELKDCRSYEQKYVLTDKVIKMLNDGIQKCFMSIGQCPAKEIQEQFENVMLHPSFKVYIKDEQKKKSQLCQIVRLL